MSGFPYELRRCGVVMSPDPALGYEAEGVLNPATAWGPDGELYLYPRLVAAGNHSRIGVARVVIEEGLPVGVVRTGVALEPDRCFERSAVSAGTEDPRITWIAALGLHVMTYVAYGPLGPRTAIAVSPDLGSWRRLGPVHFAYVDSDERGVAGLDLNLYPNKDSVFFPEPVIAPDGRESLAVLHRPAWTVGRLEWRQGLWPPDGVSDDRPSIWMSFVPLAEVRRDPSALVRWQGHRFLAGPAYDFEVIKIGAGPPPRRVPEGWLLLHHGATGTIDPGVDQQGDVHYAAGGMILDADQPWLVRDRTTSPLLTAETEAERVGTVPNVVFPTAIEEVAGQLFVFYGMADTTIGVAVLQRSSP